MNKKYFENYNDPKFLYQMLSRLESDCKYFLGNGNGAEKYLWALTVDNQISAMKEIYNKLEEKPEWLSLEQINSYEKQMKDKLSKESINTNEKNNKDSTEQIFTKIYTDLKEEMLKEDNTVFIRAYEIPSKNYSKDMNFDLWFASGIEMQLHQMMKEFDDKVFFYSYKDKYFFSNNEEKAKEVMLKEIKKETLKEQREGRMKRSSREVR